MARLKGYEYWWNCAYSGEQSNLDLQPTTLMRTFLYLCTDVAKVTLSPVYVNADDAEAVVHATLFALDYRMTFGRDVFIDLLGYRKYGHNEGDEPRFTQPKLYKAIAKHKNPRDIYADQLIQQGIVTAELKQMEKDYKNSLEEDLLDSRKIEKTEITPFMQDEWKGFERVDETKMMETVTTAVSEDILTKVAASITTELPAEKKFLRKIEKLIEGSTSHVFETDAMDWAMGELLAYGSLMVEGHDVRISGQDVEHDTFHIVTLLWQSLKKKPFCLTIYKRSRGDYGFIIHCYQNTVF